MQPKLKTVGLISALALALGVGWTYADGDARANHCKLAGVLCSKDGACEGKCREVCGQAAETFEAVRAAIGARMQREFGDKCACTTGECAAKDCVSCDFITRIFAPLLREKVAARLNDAKIAITHFSRGAGGRFRETPCSFLKGTVCQHCVNELADAAWKKANEVLFADIAATMQAVRERVVASVKAEGGPTCGCATGECTPDTCPTCQTVKATVVHPLLKQRVESRLKDLQKDFSHTARTGETGTVACTFLRGELCSRCVDEIADAVRSKLRELASSRK